jgi:hypothetical protein
MLFSAPAGKANHRAGTKAAATNIHGHLLRAHDPQLVLKKVTIAIFCQLNNAKRRFAVRFIIGMSTR